MTETVTSAVAKRDNGPGAMIKQYKSDFATVLPSHLDADTFVRVAQGLLRRDEKLAKVAGTNPGSFLSAMLDCARKGLEPGDTFHFVVFGNEIQGITDYTGEIELIYRAGEVSSVKAEVVYSKDEFQFSPDMDRPVHKVDWFGDRGTMIGAYAYGVFQNGAVSRVVVMSKTDIDQIKAVSRSAKSPESPWNKWPDRMWLKTVVKQLTKWVPSSPEYRQNVLRDNTANPASPIPLQATPPADVTHLGDGDIIDSDAVEVDQ